MSGIEVRTVSGGKFVMDDGRPYKGPISTGDPLLQESIWEHVEEHLGPVTAMMHFGAEAVSVDILWVAPSAERHFHTLVTCGMAERPMDPPGEAADCRHAELVICLPPRWPLVLNGAIPQGGRWPLQLIGGTALYPHRSRNWVWYGHTITAPPEEGPFAPDTLLASAVLDTPRQLPVDFQVLETDPERTIAFFNVIPIYREELRLAMWQGSVALLERLDQAGLADVVDPGRRNVAPEEPPERRMFAAPPVILPFPRRLR